ncbi:suppressor of hpr1 [Rhodosporidiobolus nylandii]
MSAAAAPAPVAAPPTEQERAANRARFETELELLRVRSLNRFGGWRGQQRAALAQQGLLESEPFLNYLTYLLYFRQPRYSRFLQYPQCLHHLSLLTAPGAAGESFRKALKEDGLMPQTLAGKQVAHWAGWREREGAPTGVGAGVGAEGKMEGTA